MKLRDMFVRNRRSSVLLERFLIASATTFLVIRFYLAATGYPQVGGAGLHISHMLWGGLGMLIALVLSLSFLGRRVQSIVSLLGGIGFGAFIDELGKFITSDNNYFFQPTIALIYIIFIVLLLSFRVLGELPRVSEQDRLANALHLLEEAALHDLREQDKKEILLLLRSYHPQEPHLNLLADAVEHLPVAPDSSPGFVARMSLAARSLSQRLVSSPHFTATVIIFFTGYALLLMAFGVINLLVSSLRTGIVEIGWLGSSCLSYTMIVIGMLSLRKARFAAYTWFKRAVLVSIFLTQAFLLYMQPLGTLDALLVNLIVLAMLNYLIRNSPQNSPPGIAFI